jgi:hypothetical protein
MDCVCEEVEDDSDDDEALDDILAEVDSLTASTRLWSAACTDFDFDAAATVSLSTSLSSKPEVVDVPTDVDEASTTTSSFGVWIDGIMPVMSAPGKTADDVRPRFDASSQAGDVVIPNGVAATETSSVDVIVAADATDTASVDVPLLLLLLLPLAVLPPRGGDGTAAAIDGVRLIVTIGDVIAASVPTDLDADFGGSS